MDCEKKGRGNGERNEFRGLVNGGQIQRWQHAVAFAGSHSRESGSEEGS